jgi:mRNA-degrading endonuclease HigB of HigAB toxin-antitoxin module
LPLTNVDQCSVELCHKNKNLRTCNEEDAKVAQGRSEPKTALGGNKVRLIAAIHYNRKRIYVRAVLTHDEYDKGKWKE